MNFLQSMSSFFKNSLVQYLCIDIGLYIILYNLYRPITLGLSVEDISILGVPIIFGLFLFQYFLGTHILKRPFLGHGLVALLWGLTFPILFHLSYTKPFYFYEFANDFLFGLLLFVGLTGFQYLLTLPQRFTKLIALLFALFDGLLSLVPIGQIGYYLSINHCITPSTLMALYMTNSEEAFGFLKNMLGVGGLIFASLAFILWIALLYWANLGIRDIADENGTRPLRLVVLVGSLLACFIYVPFFLFPQTCIVHNWMEIDVYMKQIQAYNTLHQNIYENFNLTTNETAAQKAPGTVILVIGESSSRNYMKVYNPAFPYEDTPWQSEMAQTNQFMLFNHAYSSYVQTVPTLERALTERNQYEDKPFLDSINILDVAKKAGYYTSWLSNQGVYGEYDTTISLIAKTADHPEWSHESYMFSDKYDGELLPLLKKVDPTKNNFIVIHIMGSHIYYNDRYPHEFSKWKKGEVPDGEEAYANSQLYTDWLLKNIYQYAKDQLNLQAMVYFSDHGESIHTSHNPDNFNFIMTRIPLWVYLSENYKNTYPLTAQTLENRKNQYFTNDLLYDLLVGIMQAPSSAYNPTRDFSHPSYRFNVNNMTTMLGEQPLSHDVDDVSTASK